MGHNGELEKLIGKRIIAAINVTAMNDSIFLQFEDGSVEIYGGGFRVGGLNNWNLEQTLAYANKIPGNITVYK
jgi:hypothetical protein